MLNRSTINRRPLAWALALSLLVAATAGGDMPRLFDTSWVGFDGSNYNSARYVYASAVADFNSDNTPDVATVTWPNIGKLTILLNNGDGTYPQPVLYPLPDVSWAVIAADLNGDNFVDLVASNTGQNWFGTAVSVYRNNGDGTFGNPTQWPCGSGPVGLAAADFDGDQDLDLAVANYGYLGQGSTVSLLRNTGDGSFESPVNFAAGTAPFELAAADFNGDDRPDLAVANGTFNSSQPSRINILFNDGAGGFFAPQQLPTFWGGMLFFPTVLAADIDLDQDVDLVYSHTGLTTAGGYAIAVIENTGSGVFAAPRPVSLGSFTGGAVSLGVADVTGDDWPDIFGANLENESWVLARSTGGGQFESVVRLSSGEAPAHVESADVDGDADVDVIVVNRDSLEVCVHVNPGDGNFSPPPTYPVEPLSQFFDHGDIDRDDDLDIVTASGTFRILRNNGDGTFAPATTYIGPSSPLDVKLRDLNGDQHLDLLWNHSGPPYAYGTAMNDGQGNFINGRDWPVPTCGYFKAEIDAFDLDNDQDLDIVQIENLGCPSEPFSSRRVFFSANNGNGEFQLVNVMVINVGPRSVAAGDFNHDNNLDLAITGQPTSILLGHGDLTFTLTDASDMPGINIVATYLNEDEHLDLAVALQRNVAPYIESMGVMLGNGDGTFQPVTLYLGSHSPDLAQISEIVAGDADGDGDIDILASNYASNDVSVWANNGDGTFQPQIRYGIGKNPLDLSYAEFSGDGVWDLAATVSSYPPLSGNVAVSFGIKQIAPGDCDGDGDVDLDDFECYLGCYSGPGEGVTTGCEAVDFNQDNDVDFGDYWGFQAVFTGSEGR